MALALLNVPKYEGWDSGVLGVSYRFALASLCKLGKSMGPKRRPNSISGFSSVSALPCYYDCNL